MNAQRSSRLSYRALTRALLEAVVVAAIRLHECIEASLRRLAAEDVACTPKSGFRAMGGMASAGVPSLAYTDQAREEAIDQGGGGSRSSRLKNRGERRCGFSGKPSSGAASTTLRNPPIVEEQPR
jgi:hypothetical protein